MTTSTTETAEFLDKYPPATPRQATPPIAQQLHALVEAHDTTEAPRHRQRMGERVAAMRRDVERVEARNIEQAQGHITKRAGFLADARDAIREMQSLATSGEQVTDETLAALGDWEGLSRRMAEYGERLVSEALFIAPKLENPLKVLNGIHEKYPTLRKQY